jgi:histidyl-tRNA synthetase
MKEIMALSTQPYKGTRDFYPEDMRLRNYMFNKWREVCESFGYEEYDGPILEQLELYTAKTSEEIVNEQSYSFTDRGDRKVIMRPEMTPTVSRMVAGRRQQLGYPLRMYSIPNCFRYERPQKGRLREFWQLNADLFGVEGIEADVEIIQLADALMKSFGAKPDSYSIRINSRKYMEELLEAQGFSKSLAPKLIALMDKADKPGFNERVRSLEPAIQERFLEFSKAVQGENKFLVDIAETSSLLLTMKKLDEIGVKTEFDPKINRGFDYYTDIVFEVFDTDEENNRSMFGGGRYDGLVGMFGVEPVPTVGFGMGDVTLENFLKSNDLVPELKPTTDLAILLIGDVFADASKLASELRAQGINVSIDATDRKLDKKIKAADKQGVVNVLFVGETELKEGQYNLKNLQTGSDEKLDAASLVAKLKV